MCVRGLFFVCVFCVCVCVCVCVFLNICVDWLIDCIYNVRSHAAGVHISSGNFNPGGSAGNVTVRLQYISHQCSTDSKYGILCKEE